MALISLFPQKSLPGNVHSTCESENYGVSGILTAWKNYQSVSSTDTSIVCRMYVSQIKCLRCSYNAWLHGKEIEDAHR